LVGQCPDVEIAPECLADQFMARGPNRAPAAATDKSSMELNA
jgi:hypothetical protein